MPKLKFTEANLRALKGSTSGRETYFDTRGSGLAVRISAANGRHPDATLKVFGVPYRHGKTQRWLTLRPNYPHLSLREAERQAIQILAKVSLGEDPAAERTRARATPPQQLHTMASVVAAFCAVLPNRRHKRTGRALSADHVAETTRYLQRSADHFGSRAIDTIANNDIRGFLEEIGAAHLVTANRVHAALRTMLGWAAERGMAPPAMMVGLDRVGVERPRDRVLNADDVGIVWAAASCLGYPGAPLVQILLATGQRLGETSRMRWRHVDGDVWLKPADETKTDRAHTVPLSSLAVEILADCPRIVDGFVFAGRAPRRPMAGFADLKKRLDEKAMELCRLRGRPDIERFRFHDLRRTCATHLGGLGVAPPTVARILNHVDMSITGKVYNLHSYDEDKRQALELWARRLRALTTTPPDNVITPSVFAAGNRS